MDVLQARLIRARATGASFMQSAMNPPWGLRLPANAELAAHAMVRGHAWLWLNDTADAIEMRAGDVVLVRGSTIHHLANPIAAACQDLTEFRCALPAHRDLTQQTVDPAADLFLCGAYRFAGDISKGLLETLPAVLHIRPEPGSRLSITTELLSQELAEHRPGQQTILDRLLDIVLVQLMREYFDDPRTPSPAWYRGEAHSGLRAPLQAMHEHPEYPWTVPELAKLAAVSRSTFVRLFNDVLGQTVMDYLTEWRMTLARDDLREGTDTLAVVARRYGYGSPYAFSAAFTRHHGAPPGRWRRTEGGVRPLRQEPFSSPAPPLARRHHGQVMPD